MQQPLINIHSLRFRYRGASTDALQDIDLAVSEGEFIVVMGPNEAGKSTLCFTLNGLIPHQVKGKLDGSVIVHGMHTRERGVKDLFPHVGLVFQDFESQLFSTSVELEVAFGPENLSLPMHELGQRIAWALEMAGISSLRKRQPGTLSGGQKQLLAIASILSIRPKVLCFDEPTTDLDPANKARIFSLTKRLAAEKQTLIIVEHESEEALSADRIVLMRDGRIMADGPPAAIFRNINLLERASVMPLQLTKLFHDLDIDELPLTVEEAIQVWSRYSFAHLSGARQRLEAGDAARAERYGPVFISMQNAHYSYPGGIDALAGVSIEVREGEFIAILGQNGSGKTTLAKLLNGLLRPTEGKVLLDGRLTAAFSAGELGRKVGYVFQNPDHQIFKETIYEEVLFGPHNLGVERDQAERQARDALETVGLWEGRFEDPFTLPKGLRQKVAVASVLATRPRAIVMDEPTTGLDYYELQQMMALVKRLNEAGHTIIMITHCIWIAAQFAHRIILMSGGKIVGDGSTRAIFANEDLLAEADVRPPQVVAFSNRLGATALSVEEFVDAVRSFQTG